MLKTITGIKFTPENFRKLEQCVCCLKASKINYGEKCEDCSKINFKYCEMCESILRSGLHRYYSYDNRDTHRDNGIGFLASKEMIREFVFEETLPIIPINETICENCKGWKEWMKDICYWCDNDFLNNKDNYKINGNMCEECAWLTSIQNKNI